MLIPLSGREKENTRKLPENSLFGKATLADEVTRYFFSKVTLFSSGLMEERWRVTLLARQLEPENGHFNKGLCSLPGCCSRKLLCQAPE